MPIVYADADLEVLENEQALPPAWLVHHAVQMDAEQALAQVAAGRVDPRRTVVLEQAPPLLDDALPAPDQATMTEYAADTVRVDAEASAPGLLVLSNVFYPAWHARGDGASTEIYIADGALRTVAVPAGAHTVEFHYASAAFPVGGAISGLTALALACATIGPKRRW
jgi:hypothetical protein